MTDQSIASHDPAVRWDCERDGHDFGYTVWHWRNLADVCAVCGHVERVPDEDHWRRWRDLGWLVVDTLGAALFIAVAVGLTILPRPQRLSSRD